MNTTVKKAYAKMNLFLSVGELFSNGKHRVETVLQKLRLHDTVTVRLTEKNGISVSSDSKEIPCDRENLAYIAAERYYNTAGLPGGAEIFIEKRIPVRAGLGGGSSDAAAVLTALEENHSAIGFDGILSIATELGVDVPFFLYDDPTMIGTEDGSVLKEFPAPECQISCVLVKIGAKESTGSVYAKLDRIRNTKHTCESAGKLSEAILSGNPGKIIAQTSNDFEICYEEFSYVKENLMRAGCDGVLLCGSGPTVCGLCVGQKKAEAVKAAVLMPATVSEFVRIIT